MIQEILRKIKENKKYKTLADSIVKKEIQNYLKKNKIKEITKQDIKQIRAKLHKTYSSFQTKKKNKRYFYIDNLKQLSEIRNPSSKDLNDIKEINNKLLSITISTKERLNNYSELYQQIFEITGTPETIVDLGSGLNPLSYPYMNLKKLNYYAYDIDEEDIKFLNEYFQIMKTQGLNGKASILDVKDKIQTSKLPPSDIIFLFKVIDIINQSEKNYKASEELIKNLIKKSKYIIVSFATKTITRKKMNYPNRKWFELMLKRNNLDFKKINISNEVFYVINCAFK
jgi:hypothetical protein